MPIDLYRGASTQYSYSVERVYDKRSLSFLTYSHFSCVNFHTELSFPIWHCVNFNKGLSFNTWYCFISRVVMCHFLHRSVYFSHGTVTFYMVLCHFAHRIVISHMVMCHFPHGIVISHMVMSRRAWPKGSSARFTYHSRTCVLFYRTCVYHR